MDTRKKKMAKRGEAGVALILVAVTIVGLGTLATVLTVDVLRGKTAYSFAQRYADEICNPAAAALPYTSQVVASVAAKVPDQLSDIEGYMSIQKVRLISPMIVTNPAGTPPLNVFTPASWSWPMTFSDFIPGHTCPASVCEFWGDVNAAPIIQTFFPGNFMTEVDYGQVAACVVEMEADTLLLGKRYVVAKSAVGLYVRNSSITAPKSVIIGVAPQMEVTVPPEPDCGAQPFVADRFSPLQNFGSPYDLDIHNSVYRTCPTRQDATDPGGPNGSFTGPSPIDDPLGLGIFNSYRLTSYPIAYPPLGSGIVQPIILSSHIPTAGVANVGRREQQAASYNIVSAFRNRLVTSWVERLSRMGNQRLRFQFLVVNSQNDNVISNPPTLVKGAGLDESLHDPLNDNFIFPMVNHFDSNIGRMYCPWMDSAWLAGFNQCSQGERAYMNQLRKAYHVFHQGSTGVQSLGDPSARNVLNGNDFEPAAYASSPNPAPAYDGTAPDPWEQRGNPDRISLTELTRMLGVEERCPNNTDIPCPGGGTKPAPGANPPVQPLPDLVAFLQYARGAAQAWHPVGPIWTPAHLGPFGNVPASQAPTISNPDLGGANTAQSSDIVIVTAKPILNNAERDAIGTEVDFINAARKITVIFLTLSEGIRTDANVMVRFNQAFRVGTRDSVVIRIAPDPANPFYALAAGCNIGMSPSEDNCLYNFYNGLQTHYTAPPAPLAPPYRWHHNVTNFAEIANGIFDGRIAERRLAL